MQKKLTGAQILSGIADRMKSLVKINPYRNLKAWDYQKNIIGDSIQADDIMLDIGSGSNPSPRANILADFFPEDNFHRNANLIDDRPTVVCSVERLPFSKKSIDFVLCSHVLEHVENPSRACEAIQRIAKQGYLETPAYGKDLLVGTGYMHLWQVVAFENALHFFQYSDREKEASQLSSPVIKLWWRKRYHPWQDFFWDRQDVFNACLLWKDSFECNVHWRMEASAKPIKDWKQINSDLLPKRESALTETEIAMLENVLAAPDGIAPMKFNGSDFVNTEGGIMYPVSGKRIYVEMAESGTH